MNLVGWSCQSNWEHYIGSSIDEFGGIKTEHDMNLIAHSFGDQVASATQSSVDYCMVHGSDRLPRPELEQRYLDILENLDDRPYIGAAKQKKASLQDTRHKMAGPYEYVAPNYWCATPRLPACVRLQHRDRHRRSGAAEGIGYTYA